MEENEVFVPEPVEEEPTPASEPAPTTPASKEPSRFQPFIRKALIWLTIVAVAFLAGFLTLRQIQYKPTAEKLAQARADLDQANETVDDLQGKLDEANRQAASLEEENQALSGQLEVAEAHLELLQVLVDVSTARLALVSEDVEGAITALADTEAHLTAVLPSIKTYDATLAETLPQRLSLILSNLDADVETATIDIELLTKDLLKAESALFTED